MTKMGENRKKNTRNQEKNQKRKKVKTKKKQIAPTKMIKQVSDHTKMQIVEANHEISFNFSKEKPTSTTYDVGIYHNCWYFLHDLESRLNFE